MNELLIGLIVVFAIMLIFAIRNQRLNQQILKKQKQLNEVNIKIESSFMTPRNITMALSSFVVAFILVSSNPAEEMMPRMMEDDNANFALAESYSKNADESEDYGYSRDGAAFCISGTIADYSDSNISMMSDGNNEVDYIFSVSSETYGQYLLDDYKENETKIGVYVTEIMESYPNQGNALEIVEECE
jgi:hypothetical protein